MSHEPWMFEYCYYKNPGMLVTSDNMPEIEEKMKKLNFYTKEAKAFHEGWLACLACFEDRVNNALQELDP